LRRIPERRALEDLRLLGIDVTSLGAVPINYVRLAAARRAAQARCHFRSIADAQGARSGAVAKLSLPE